MSVHLKSGDLVKIIDGEFKDKVGIITDKLIDQTYHKIIRPKFIGVTIPELGEKFFKRSQLCKAIPSVLYVEAL